MLTNKDQKVTKPHPQTISKMEESNLNIEQPDKSSSHTPDTWPETEEEFLQSVEQSDSLKQPLPHSAARELAEMRTSIEKIQQQIDERLRYDETKEKAFNHLYTELGRLQEDSQFSQNRSLFIDLILLYDRMEHSQEDIKQGHVRLEEVEHLLQTLKDELLEILYRREIEIVSPDSPIFDPKQQQAIGMESTEREEEHKQVAHIVRRGFRHKERILRAEEVILKKFNPPDMSSPLPQDDIDLL